MGLVKGKLATKLFKRIKEKNAKPVELNDVDKNLKEHCELMEELVYEAIKSMEIVIPPGLIQVAGSATLQSNPKQIVIKLVIR